MSRRIVSLALSAVVLVSMASPAFAQSNGTVQTAASQSTEDQPPAALRGYLNKEARRLTHASGRPAKKQSWVRENAPVSTAILGAGLGAAVGYAMAKDNSAPPVSCAVIGAGIGAVVGAALGLLNK